MNVPKAFSLAFCLTLLILFLAGCGSPPVTPEPTAAPPPPPAAPVTTNPSANWQLYVTGMLVGDAAAPLVEQLALPEPTAGRQWLLLKLTLENISDTWLALPADGISGGLLDSGGSELALTGLDFAPYTRLPDGEDIALAPRFQVAGLAWVEILSNHTPTEVWLDIEDNQTGQTPERVNVNLTESSQPPPLFNAIQLPISPPGTVFDFPDDLRATVTSVQLEPAAGDQFRVRVDLDLENTGGTALALAGDQFAQIWGMDKGGRYFCCLAVEAGQGGDFGPDKKLAPGQLAQGYLATQPFTSEAGTTPEALVVLTLRGRTNAVTEIFLARVQTGDGGQVSNVPAAASLLATNLALVEANGIAVVGNVAYLTDSAGLHLLDIANPTAPQEIDFYPAGGAPGVVVDGPIVYLPSGGQLHLIDIFSPAAPQLVGLYPLPPYGGSYLAVAGHMLYLSAGQEGFISLDVSNPATIRELGRVAGDTSKIAVLGQTVYAVDGVDTLRIFDVADPAQPHLLGAFRPGDVITDLVVAPSPADPSIPLAYLGTLGRGVRLVDVSNPAGPRQIGAYPSKGSAYSLALAGDRLYVANGWAASGLSVVDISNPAVPVEVSFIPAAREWDSVVDLAAVATPGGVNVYIAGRFEGLLVYPDIPGAISPVSRP